MFTDKSLFTYYLFIYIHNIMDCLNLIHMQILIEIE